MFVAKIYDFHTYSHIYLKHIEEIEQYYIDGEYCFFSLHGLEYCVEMKCMTRILELAPYAKRRT